MECQRLETPGGCETHSLMGMGCFLLERGLQGERWV